MQTSVNATVAKLISQEIYWNA